MKNYYVNLKTVNYPWDYNYTKKEKRIIIPAHNEKEIEAIIICFWDGWEIVKIEEFTPTVARRICHPVYESEIEDF